MDWFKSVQKQAQEAAEKLMSSEAAEMARQLAQQASQQAAALAREATEKAQEVAKEALEEAQKSLRGTDSNQSATPLQYGITPELEQFVRSLTYSTFSEYPLDSLDVPPDPADQKLNSWQEAHARLVLQQVPQLQDLRFVLCPKYMDEYIFWIIYFTLSKRYLPVNACEQQEAAEAAVASSNGSTLLPGPTAAAAAAAAGTDTSPSLSPLQQETPEASARQEHSDHEASAALAVDGGKNDDEDDDVDVDAELAALADDPELDAYLQVALNVDGGAAGGAADSDLDDLDDYINQLDAEVNRS